MIKPMPKAAIALYDGFSMLEFAALYEPLTTQAGLTWAWDVCALTTDVYDGQGLHIYPTRITTSLAGYAAVIVPGGPGARTQMNRATTREWLASAQAAPLLAASGDGALLLAAAGLAKDRRVAVTAENRDLLATFSAIPEGDALVLDGRLATARDVDGAVQLGCRLPQMLRDIVPTWIAPAEQPDLAAIPVTSAPAGRPRQASLTRETRETRVEIRLDIDGSGQHQIDTGLPFLDHMLAQIAVHGLFDLTIRAKGDLQVDPHHTVEDVGLTLGSAFQQALGDRAGIVRMASAECPMDDSLAWVAVDLSGRPYSVIQADWHGPSVGSLPVSLLPHFLESFALQARCNLHACVRYGRDDHHQAEAIFKALARALDAATRIDPRRAGQVPSSKGVL